MVLLVNDGSLMQVLAVTGKAGYLFTFDLDTSFHKIYTLGDSLLKLKMH